MLSAGVPSMAGLDWSQCPAVESVPGKVSGAWVLKGTRMPVSAIFENLEAGANLDDIMKWYDGLDRGQVRDVLEFAARGKRGVCLRPQKAAERSIDGIERPSTAKAGIENMAVIAAVNRC